MSFSVGNNVSSATLAYMSPGVHSLTKISMSSDLYVIALFLSRAKLSLGKGILNASKKTEMSS